MGRSRYKIVEPTHPHFVTCTVLNWHWRYSSARDYEGMQGLIEVERFW